MLNCIDFKWVSLDILGTLDTGADLDLESAVTAAGAAWPPGLAFGAAVVAAVAVAVLAAAAAFVDGVVVVVFGFDNFFLASSTALRISSTVLG